MLNHTKRESTRSILFISAFLFFAIAVQSQNTSSRIIEKDLEDIVGGSLKIEHHRGELHVRQSSDQHAHLKLEISAEGRDEQEVEEFIETISLKMTGSGKNWTIKTGDEIKSWNSTNGSSRIKLQDGSVYHDIRELDLNFIVEVPELATLRLKNKYDDIYLSDFDGDLYVELYTGELQAKDIGGALTVDLKYGHATVGNIADANLTLYESEVEVKNCGKLTIDSKYSTYQIENATALVLTSYEDEITTKDITGDVELEAKYGELDMGNLGNVKISCYETELSMLKTKNFSGDIKYGDIDLESVDVFELTSNYETDIDIGKVGKLLLRESKYGSVEVGQIATHADITSHETSLEVRAIGDQFRELRIDSKYEYIDFPLRPGLSYEMDADLKYGDLEYAESLFAHQHNRLEVSSNIKVLASSTAAPDVKLFIRAYETDVDLRMN